MTRIIVFFALRRRKPLYGLTANLNTSHYEHPEISPDMAVLHSCRNPQRRIAGTCAGQGIGRKMGFARKWNYTEYLHFSDYMAAFATHRTAFRENLHHNRTVMDFSDHIF